jgi:hypothetical protein
MDEYFSKAIKFLNEYNWIYDFQLTEIFSNDILELKFPHEV